MRRLAELRLVREPVAGKERVWDDEAHVAEGQIVQQPPVRPVEEGEGGQRARSLRLDLAAEKPEAETRVDDVVEEQYVLPPGRAHRLAPQARRLAGAIRLELEDVPFVWERQRVAEVVEEELRAERREQEQPPPAVVRGDLRGELGHAALDVPPVEEGIRRHQDAIRSPKRSARRSMSRR